MDALPKPIPAPAPALPDVATAVRDRAVAGWKQYPTRSNRASALGHPCLRYLTYKRRYWREEAPPEPTLLMIFGEGHLHEQAVIRSMLEAGFRVIEQQRAFEWPEHEITGMIDGLLVCGDEMVPFDVKSTSSYTFRSIDTTDDLRNHPYHYVRSWYSQMVLYLLLGNRERGLIVMKDKSTGLLKQILVPLDYAHAEELVQKAEAVNAHVRAETLPDRMPYDERICGECSFFHLCLPDEALRGGLQLLDDPELLAQIRRRLDLEAGAKEFDRLDKQIKDRCKQAFADEGGTAEAVVGTEFLVRVSQQNRKGYEVAPSVVTMVKIQRLGKTNGEGREEVTG